MASPQGGLFCSRSIQRAVFFSFFSWTLIQSSAHDVESCNNLRLGQYLCKSPKIDDATQEPENCKDLVAWVECLPAPNISCLLPNRTRFKFSGEEVGFNKSVPCRNVTGYSYKVAVALSLFLGWLGADRFYLGYPALAVMFLLATFEAGHSPGYSVSNNMFVTELSCIVVSQACVISLTRKPAAIKQTLFKGLLKFCTVGFCGIGSLVDFILISMQIVGPSDGSDYIVDYYGARLVRLSITNETYRRTQISL